MDFRCGDKTTQLSFLTGTCYVVRLATAVQGNRLFFRSLFAKVEFLGVCWMTLKQRVPSPMAGDSTKVCQLFGPEASSTAR